MHANMWRERRSISFPNTQTCFWTLEQVKKEQTRSKLEMIMWSSRASVHQLFVLTSSHITAVTFSGTTGTANVDVSEEMYTLLLGWTLYCKEKLPFNVERPPCCLFLWWVWEKGALPSIRHTSLQVPTYRKRPFSHQLSVRKPITFHINGPNGLTSGSSPSSPSLLY